MRVVGVSTVHSRGPEYFPSRTPHASSLDESHRLDGWRHYAGRVAHTAAAAAHPLFRSRRAPAHAQRLEHRVGTGAVPRLRGSSYAALPLFPRSILPVPRRRVERRRRRGNAVSRTARDVVAVGGDRRTDVRSRAPLAWGRSRVVGDGISLHHDHVREQDAGDPARSPHDDLLSGQPYPHPRRHAIVRTKSTPCYAAFPWSWLFNPTWTPLSV